MGDQEKPQIDIGWTEAEDGPWMYVRDNGLGIAPEMLDRIFEPFQRVGAVEVAGSGVGLAIVKTVVEQYGGAVSVVSTPGRGSTFSFKLPTLAGRWPARHVQVQAGAGSSRPPAESRRIS